METKQQLIDTIKKWVKIDNEIRVLQKEQNVRKKEKQNISKELISVMKNNEIDCFDINDGQIMYSRKSVKKPITQKVLLNLLANYYNGDVLKATELNEYIMVNREETIQEKIVRKVNEPCIDK
jgi:hypothetical protein